MKYFISCALATAALASAATHDHHQHAHFHQHKQRDTETVVVNDVAVKYVFDGKEVSYADVCHGLANGTFVWDPSVPDKPNCNVNAPAPAPAETKVEKPSPAVFLQKSASPAAAPVPIPASNNVPVNANYLSLLQSNPGVDQDFPDGELPCTFDSIQKFGAVPLNYLGRGGFTAIVSANIVNKVISGLSGNLNSGGNGNYFSYACPEGYMKAQWPPQASSQTVGGLLCDNGVFRLTNPNSNKLCTPGAGFVTAVNQLGKVVSVCNTDYPATEDETVPHRVAAGGSAKLAITESGSYFKANGASMTSAQYYLNPSGYDIQDACQWGTNDGRAIGNWAPVNLGLGTDADGGMVYIGLFSAEQVLHDPASPGTPKNLDYNIKVSGPGQTCEYRLEGGQGNFYLNGALRGTLGQTFQGKSVPGATCAYPAGSDMSVTFS